MTFFTCSPFSCESKSSTPLCADFPCFISVYPGCGLEQTPSSVTRSARIASFFLFPEKAKSFKFKIALAGAGIVCALTRMYLPNLLQIVLFPNADYGSVRVWGKHGSISVWTLPDCKKRLNQFPQPSSPERASHWLLLDRYLMNLFNIMQMPFYASLAIQSPARFPVFSIQNYKYFVELGFFFSFLRGFEWMQCPCRCFANIGVCKLVFVCVNENQMWRWWKQLLASVPCFRREKKNVQKHEKKKKKKRKSPQVKDGNFSGPTMLQSISLPSNVLFLNV